MLDEGRLHGMHLLGHSETFDRGDLRALGHDRQGETGNDAATVDQHGARSTLPQVASLLRAGKMQMLA